MTERSQRTETNTNQFTHSTVQGPVVAGSHASVTVGPGGGTAEEQAALAAVDQLRVELTEALQTLDRRDDQTRESLRLAAGRLDGLEDELRAGPDERDPERAKRLLGGIRDTVAGLAGIVTGVDGLWVAVQNVLR